MWNHALFDQIQVGNLGVNKGRPTTFFDSNKPCTNTIHPNLHYVTLPNVTPLLHPRTLGNICAWFHSPSLSSHPPPYITCFNIKIIQIHQRIETTRLHTSRCHHRHSCNVDFVLFHDVTHYINSMLSHIHNNTMYLHIITCNLVATSMILERLECSAAIKHHVHHRSSPSTL